MGHEEQAARERGEPFLEVRDGVEIEVVGRLVEDEGIPLAREQRGERDALLLPARQLVGRRVEHVAHAEARQHRFALPLLTIEAVAHRGAHGAGRQHRELGQRADPGVAAAAHDARLGLAVAAHHREQRALAAAVETDDADAVAVAEGEREIGEQRPIRAGRPQALCIDQNHGSGYGALRRVPRGLWLRQPATRHPTRRGHRAPLDVANRVDGRGNGVDFGSCSETPVDVHSDQFPPDQTQDHL